MLSVNYCTYGVAKSMNSFNNLFTFGIKCSHTHRQTDVPCPGRCTPQRSHWGKSRRSYRSRWRAGSEALWRERKRKKRNIIIDCLHFQVQTFLTASFAVSTYWVIKVCSCILPSTCLTSKISFCVFTFQHSNREITWTSYFQLQVLYERRASFKCVFRWRFDAFILSMTHNLWLSESYHLYNRNAHFLHFTIHFWIQFRFHMT